LENQQNKNEILIKENNETIFFLEKNNDDLKNQLNEMEKHYKKKNQLEKSEMNETIIELEKQRNKTIKEYENKINR
jgi:hypothetical protein